MRNDEVERLVMELRDEKLQREAVATYKKDRFLFWKDVALVAFAAASVVVSVIALVRTF